MCVREREKLTTVSCFTMHIKEIFRGDAHSYLSILKTNSMRLKDETVFMNKSISNEVGFGL